ncbi:uncharacterized protein LOC131328129 [Rhododendron vialii]|uniref:uncharacterized protein LOC131328129 n=1 Tax=Rhododendron vialii TaxID=182163 RepID=UPI00265F03CC|nr:uncharacterized protein LOC131328129 [Rhododendron vialii]
MAFRVISSFQILRVDAWMVLDDQKKYWGFEPVEISRSCSPLSASSAAVARRVRNIINRIGEPKMLSFTYTYGHKLGTSVNCDVLCKCSRCYFGWGLKFSNAWTG